LIRSHERGSEIPAAHHPIRTRKNVLLLARHFAQYARIPLRARSASVKSWLFLILIVALILLLAGAL
jgi:hypothetical protein